MVCPFGLSSRYNFHKFNNVSAVLVKSVVTLPGRCATTVSADRTNVSTMQRPNVVVLISGPALASGPARNGQLMGQPLHHRQRGNEQPLLRQLIPTELRQPM